MDYKIVPFNQVADPAAELKRIIDSETGNGYRYAGHEYNDKMQPGSSGCFGIGATPPTTVHVGFVVFEKQ